MTHSDRQPLSDGATSERAAALVGGLTIGMLPLLVVTGTPGRYPDGALSGGYWGYLFIPVVLAWAPLASRLFN